MSQDTGPRLAATVIVLSVMAYPLLALRIYIRLSTRAWGADDWSMLFAAIPFTALTIACLGGAFNGIGGHEAELGAEQVSIGLHVSPCQSYHSSHNELTVFSGSSSSKSSTALQLCPSSLVSH
jgi:hypothetical protein